MPRLTEYSTFERRQVYASVRRILDRFEANDHVLVQVSELSRPDGYGAGAGNGGGSRGSDHSDSTANAVSSRVDGNDEPGIAFASLVEALDVMGRADVHLRRALKPPEEPTKPKPAAAQDIWCVSCIRARKDDKSLLFVPRTTRTAGRRDLCDWCQREWLGSSEDPTKRKLPDPALCLARDRGLRLTEAARAKILTDKSRTKKRRRRSA